MANDPEAAKPRLTGDAAWKAQLNAIEQRNTAARKDAHAHKEKVEATRLERERRLASVEIAQLQALNKKAAKRNATSS